jgi:hypothetical protein
MSELLIAVLVGLIALFFVAVLAAYRRVPFKAGVKAGAHEITFELNGAQSKPEKLTSPSSTLK